MIRGLYTSVSGLITLQQEQETVTNNIANVNNNGFKKSVLVKQSFDDVLIANRQKLVGNKYVSNEIGNLNLGVMTDDVKTVFTQGSFKSTENMTDFGIDGRGFFVAQNGNQRVFTRDGNFKVNNQGYLITSDGSDVLGRNLATNTIEPIYVGNNKFSLDGENNLDINDVGATHKLLTADFENYDSLEVLGENYITSDPPIYDAQVKVRQFVIENSNIDATEQMTKLMEIKRQFETNQKFIKMQDETLEKAANQIGRV
ncbi:MAG: flagellar basal body rod protein FlgG [Clostridium butyricum]|nr:flagellar basal body rod protein FlgG [Clostridium butyricum]